MEKMKIRELMRPVEEFPSISSQATFMEAVEALEKAQDAYQSGTPWTLSRDWNLNTTR